jgi:hypothetical protein
MYQFTCLPNGLASAPRIFTKILKPIFAKLRLQGHVVVGYIDDVYLQGDSPNECMANIKATMQVFSDCGFIIHPVKSCYSITYLGFQINSKEMLVTMTPEKMRNMVTVFKSVLLETRITIRRLAEIIGLIVASFAGAEYDPLLYRILEISKSTNLKLNFGDYGKLIVLSAEFRSEIQWWIDNICTKK